MRKADRGVDRLVIEAEAIVQQAWVAQLRERCEEVQEAHSRALTRRADMERSLSRAHRGGDPRQVAVERGRLEEARRLAAKLGQAAERFRRVLAIEETQLVSDDRLAGDDRDDGE